MDELTLLRSLDPDTPGPSPAETAAALARLLAAIDAQPSASGPPASSSRLSFLERFARRRFWAPVAAAAAVAAIAITGAVIAAHTVPATRRPAPGPPSAPLPRLADGLPAYFLEYSIGQKIEYSTPGLSRRGLPSHETVRVVATATGKVAATAALPGYATAIAGSSGAFFAAVVKDNLARFYEIRLNDSRTATTVSELPIRPDTAPLAFMAVSPDGTKLAYSTDAASGAFHNLVVASTTGGSQREWLPPPQDSQGWMGPMSWLADGRTLAFNWAHSQRTVSDAYLRLLDTEAPGSDLMAGRRVLPSVYDAHRLINDAALSPDGQVVAGASNASAANRAPVNSVLAFATATGKETVLYQASPNGTYERGCYTPPLWISNTGSEVLVTCFQAEADKTRTPRFVTVLINHGHATVLPWLNAITDLDWFTAFPPSPAPVNQGVTHVVARAASGSPLSGWEITLIIIVSFVLTAGVAIVYLTNRPWPGAR
jgi:WD40-like Beta Propeller Repeat